MKAPQITVTSVGSLATLGGAPVCAQVAENPQILASGPTVFCVGIGPADFASNLRGEALYRLDRPDPLIAFTPAAPPGNWSDVGGFGGGFALYPVPQPVGPPDLYAAASLGMRAPGVMRKGFAWLGCRAGQDYWTALREDGGWDRNPAEAHLFIHLEDYGQTETFEGGVVWHPAGFRGLDDYFYLFVGVSGAGGIGPIAIRFMSPLGGMEILGRGGWGPFDGVLTQPILDRGLVVPPGSVDMHCLCPLTKADGSDGGLLAFYSPLLRGWQESEWAYEYSPTQTPPWEWSEQGNLTLGPLAKKPLTRTGPGGQALAVAQLHPGDSTLLAYLATSNQECPQNQTGLLQLQLGMS